MCVVFKRFTSPQPLLSDDSFPFLQGGKYIVKKQDIQTISIARIVDAAIDIYYKYHLWFYCDENG